MERPSGADFASTSLNSPRRKRLEVEDRRTAGGRRRQPDAVNPARIDSGEIFDAELNEIRTLLSG